MCNARIPLPQLLIKYHILIHMLRHCSDKSDNSPLWSVRPKFGFNECMLGAKFVQAAMGGCLQTCLAQ